MRTWDVVEGNLHDSTGCQSLHVYYGVIDLYHQRSVRKSPTGRLHLYGSVISILGFGKPLPFAHSTHRMFMWFSPYSRPVHQDFILLARPISPPSSTMRVFLTDS